MRRGGTRQVLFAGGRGRERRERERECGVRSPVVPKAYRAIGVTEYHY